MKREHAYQIVDGEWYRLAHGKPPYLHECCKCGLVHTVEFKVENGGVWERWTIVEEKPKRRRRKPSG